MRNLSQGVDREAECGLCWRAPFVGWMSHFVGFAVVALAVWLGFRFIPEKNADAVHLGSGTTRRVGQVGLEPTTDGL